MFGRNRVKAMKLARAVSAFSLEGLEDRRLLSAAGHHVQHATSTSSGSTSSSADPTCGGGHGGSSTTFAVLDGTGTGADVAAATELQTLATADGLGTIAGTTVVHVRSEGSSETYYSVTLSGGTGVSFTLTSDDDGNPITPPTHSTLTFGTLSGTGTGSDAAAASEISTLATDLDLDAPTTTTNVNELVANGLTTYTIRLAPSSGTGHDKTITVDAAGNPSGDSVLQFQFLPTVISGGLQTLASALTTPQTIAATQNVLIQTDDGVTTYTVRLTGTGQSIKLTVGESGGAATPPSGGGYGGGFGGFHGFSGFGFGGHHHGF